jgi:hypothetical protein
MELTKLGDWLRQLYEGYLKYEGYLNGWTIIEHRVGSETMIGWIERCGFDTGGRFSIYWTERKGYGFTPPIARHLEPFRTARLFYFIKKQLP